jgi:hypothetical protein
MCGVDPGGARGLRRSHAGKIGSASSRLSEEDVKNVLWPSAMFFAQALWNGGLRFSGREHEDNLSVSPESTLPIGTVWASPARLLQLRRAKD